MKTNILSVAGLAIIASSLFITGCKKDDVTAPVVTLTGASAVTISLQGTYTELGATATDDRDDKVTVETSGTVDKNMVGDYTITYSSTDAAGNTGTATRTVSVVNEAAYLAGTYTGSEVPTYTYNVNKPFIITASTTVNNRVITNRFGDYDNNVVYMNITATTIDIPTQTVTMVGSGTNTCDVSDRTTSGNGTISGSTLTITYNDAKVNGCSGSRTGVVATLVKQ